MAISGPIVIVDDDEDDHYIIQRACERIGVTSPIRFFDNGMKALEFIRQSKERPFIILSDVNMPVMSGVELKQAINQDEFLKSRNIPFVFFSTSGMPKLVENFFTLGVQGFFIKSQSLEEIQSTLRVIFDYWEKCQHRQSLR